MAMKNYQDVDHYIADHQDGELRERLQRIRATIQQAAPNALETISYKMPAYKQNGILVYFAAFKNHVSFFPTSNGVEMFKDRLGDYKTSKGTIQFSNNQEIPYDLIAEIVNYRLQENEAKTLKKRK